MLGFITFSTQMYSHIYVNQNQISIKAAYTYFENISHILVWTTYPSCVYWIEKLITIYKSVQLCMFAPFEYTLWPKYGLFEVFYSIFLWEMCWILNNLFLWLAAPIFYNFLPIYLNISTLNLQVFVKAVSTEINAFISKRLAPRAKEVLLHSCPFKKLLYPKAVCDPLHF